MNAQYVKRERFQIFNVDTDPSTPITFKKQIDELTCRHCGKVTFFSVPQHAFDFEPISKRYESALNKLIDEHNQTMADLDAMYGPNNHVVSYYRNRITTMVEAIKQEFKLRIL